MMSQAQPLHMIIIDHVVLKCKFKHGWRISVNKNAFKGLVDCDFTFLTLVSV